MAIRNEIQPLAKRLQAFGRFQQKRNVSLADKMIIHSPTNKQLSTDLSKAIALVKKYDPVGYLPGLLIHTNYGKIGYFAS